MSEKRIIKVKDWTLVKFLLVSDLKPELDDYDAILEVKKLVISEKE